MKIGFVLFPQLTQLDLTGPLQVLHRLPGATTFLAAKTLEPVPSDCGLSLVPTTRFEDCPPLDVLCVPGGFGVEQAIVDAETIRLLERQAANARAITSVCTGAFLLGRVGLLRGKRATTHWAYHHLLPLVGAIPVRERVVRDARLVTGAGVTAGIDFALTLAAELAGPDTAKAIQLALEYDPAPPFSSGSMPTADAGTVELLRKRYDKRVSRFAAELGSAHLGSP